MAAPNPVPGGNESREREHEHPSNRHLFYLPGEFSHIMPAGPLEYRGRRSEQHLLALCEAEQEGRASRRIFAPPKYRK